MFEYSKGKLDCDTAVFYKLKKEKIIPENFMFLDF